MNDSAVAAPRKAVRKTSTKTTTAAPAAQPTTWRDQVEAMREPLDQLVESAYRSFESSNTDLLDLAQQALDAARTLLEGFQPDETTSESEWSILRWKLQACIAGAISLAAKDAPRPWRTIAHDALQVTLVSDDDSEDLAIVRQLLEQQPAEVQIAKPMERPLCLDGTGAYLSNGKAPMSIANPACTPVDLLSWAYGNLSQLDVLLQVVADGQGFSMNHDPAQFAYAVRHLLSPAADAIEAASQRLHDADMARSGGAA